MEEQFAKPEIRKEENIVYKRTDLLVDRPLSYCPGMRTRNRSPDDHGSNR